MANGLTLRKNVNDLQPEDVDAQRDAYRKMMAISGTDNRSWIYWAGYHGFPNWFCWHHGRVGFQARTFTYNLFLPWHRAYLLFWEHTAKDQNDGFALPWWDWTSNSAHEHGIPDIFSVANAGGEANSLASGPVPDMPDWPAHQTTREPSDPGSLPTTDDVEALLALTSFEDFTAQVEDVHDGIHGWVGGDMGSVATAAYDPIFWAHHCMIDRIWYLWQLRQGVNNIPQDYLDRPLRPFNLRVRDVLDVNRLGYEYAVSEVSIVPVFG